MSNIDKQALRGQSVEGPFYLAECGYCGQIMPSSKLRVLHSPDGEADCYCPHCNAEDCEIFDLGIVGSEVVNAWNYQQKRIEALLDELEAAEKRIAEIEVRAFNPALLDVISERQRQRSVECWTSEHDDQYSKSQLLWASSCYVLNTIQPFNRIPLDWPWAPEWWKPTDPRRDLVKAGALILAEIERIDRAAGTAKGE